MAHTINQQYIHFIWATKNLDPLIIENNQNLMLSYFSGILKKLGGQILTSSASSNHVHLLTLIPTNLSVADLSGHMKSCSSKWYRENDTTNLSFGWNEGYSAFTVSPTSVDNVQKYFNSEAQRHKSQSYEAELQSFLCLHDIEFNPKFLTKTTYTKLIYHLVWSVKNRDPVLHNSDRETLHHCIREGVQNNGCKLYGIGNVADHIHLLIECSSKITTANLVQSLKTMSTHTIKSQHEKYSNFCWQEGYGVFSVGKPALETVSNYVNNQEEHHSVKSFDQEWNWLKTLR